jgi:hypothetical protein
MVVLLSIFRLRYLMDCGVEGTRCQPQKFLHETSIGGRRGRGLM